MEALDIAFLSKFIEPKHKQFVIESLVNVFNDAVIDDYKLKLDVRAILGGMILKNFEDEKRTELLDVINMRKFESDLEEFMYDTIGDQLDAKDKIIEEKDNALKEYKDKIAQLKKISDLNSPEAKKILNSF